MYSVAGSKANLRSGPGVNTAVRWEIREYNAYLIRKAVEGF